MKATSEPIRIASHHLKHMMEFAAVRGVLRRQMLDVVPYSYDYIYEETNTVSPGEFYSVLEVIDRSLKDEHTGIRSGRFLNMRALGLIYQISLQAATIEEAFYYLGSYLDTTFPIIEMETDISDQYVSIHLNINNSRDRLNRIILENVLTVIGREIKMMAGERVKMNRFSPFYRSDYPASWTYGEVFGLRFKSTLLRGSLTDRSRLHLDILIPEYLKLTETFKADRSFTSRVKIAALNLADPELPDLDTVADSFNLTTRTLQRRLQSENSTFRQITDELKRTISDMLLLHKRFSVADVSFVLGYSEPAAFIHSFKKWHGVSPQKYRNVSN